MKNLIRILLLVAVAAPVRAFTQTPDTAAPAAGTGGLNPGDQIRIVVWRKPEFSGDFPIAANGTIIHPLYREVHVTGVPLSVVEDRLRTYLTRYETTPQFVIQPLVRIVLGGEIRTPNIYSVPPETTIAQAIALAGGPTDRGDIRDVHVVRDRQDIKMDVSKPDSDAGVLQIRSGDQIVVGRTRPSPWTIIGPISSTIAAAAAITTVIRR
ncbi:MAG: polysaccharide biosynthesis/export family protein [Gemmatimonadales bacterium]